MTPMRASRFPPSELLLPAACRSPIGLADFPLRPDHRFVALGPAHDLREHIRDNIELRHQRRLPGGRPGPADEMGPLGKADERSQLWVTRPDRVLIKRFEQGLIVAATRR